MRFTPLCPPPRYLSTPCNATPLSRALSHLVIRSALLLRTPPSHCNLTPVIERVELSCSVCMCVSISEEKDHSARRPPAPRPSRSFARWVVSSLSAERRRHGPETERQATSAVSCMQRQSRAPLIERHSLKYLRRRQTDDGLKSSCVHVLRRSLIVAAVLTAAQD